MGIETALKELLAWTNVGETPAFSITPIGVSKQDGVQHVKPHHNQREAAGDLEATPVAREAL